MILAKGARLLENALCSMIKMEIPETPAETARVRRSTLAHKETTPKLAEAVPAESEGISAFNAWHCIFFVRGGFEYAVSSPAGPARVRRSTLAHKETTPKLAEAVPAESEQPRAEINNHIYTEGLFQCPLADSSRRDESIFVKESCWIFSSSRLLDAEAQPKSRGAC